MYLFHLDSKYPAIYASDKTSTPYFLVFILRLFINLLFNYFLMFIILVFFDIIIVANEGEPLPGVYICLTAPYLLPVSSRLHLLNPNQLFLPFRIVHFHFLKTFLYNCLSG